MEFLQAASFVQKVIGSELCAGADHDENATYLLSPIPRAFIEGAIGWDNTPHTPYGADSKHLMDLGTFFSEVGQALKVKAEEMVDVELKRTTPEAP